MTVAEVATQAPSVQPAVAPGPTETASGQAANAVVGNSSPNSIRSSGAISAAAQAQQLPKNFATPGLQNPLVANGPANDAYQLLAAVTGANSARPQQLLAALSNQASSNFSTVEKVYRNKLDAAVDRQIASLSVNERSQAVTRLQSQTTAALLAALREGTGVAGLKDRNLIGQALHKMAEQLHQLQMHFGVENTEPVSRSAAAEARAQLDQFVHKLDEGISVERRSMDATQARQSEMNQTVDSPEALALLVPDSEHPFVCESFLKDAPRSCCILERPDGSREFLIPPDIARHSSSQQQQEIAANRLLEFCHGDEEKSLLLSRLANQSTLAATVLPALHMAGQIELPTDNAGFPANIVNQATRGSNYLIRENEDGSHSAFANDYNQLTYMEGASDGSIAAQYFNSNLSHHYAQIHLTVDSNNRAQLEGMKYDFVSVPLLAANDNEDLLGSSENFYNGQVDKWQLAAELHDMDALGQLSFDGADLQQANRWAADLDVLQDRIEQAAIDPNHKRSLLQRLEFITDATAEIDQLIESGQAADADQAVARAGAIHDDLTLLAQDLQVKLQFWSQTQPSRQLATLTAALCAALGNAAAEFAGAAADHAATLDDARGNLDAVVANSLTGRAQNALSQAEANVLATSKAIGALFTQGVDVPDPMLDLLRESQQRLAQARQNHQAAQAGNTARVAGPGSRGEQLKQAQQELSARLDRGEQLPTNHPQLSEANLFKVRVDKIKSDHPDLAATLANFDADFAQFSEDAINHRNWQPIEKRFADIDSSGTLRTVTSRIVPARNFAAGFAAYGGSGRGVGSHSRASGVHVSNLAGSSLANDQGVVFTGLRHGIIDAYTITADKVARMPQSQLEQLHRNTLATDATWQAWAAKRGGGDFKSDLALLRSAAGSRVAATRAKEVANRNAAVELVRAAIVENPFLYQQAVTGNNVEVTIDSVSLVTPDYLRGLIGIESERAMQRNQRVALAEIAKAPIQIELIDKQGNLHMVPVKVDARDFNFGVNSYALTKGERIPLFGKLMGWDSADARNDQLLTRMLGPLNAAGFGGEVADALTYLEGGPAAESISAQARHTLAGVPGDAFADRQLRADAIRTLAGQIKEIYNSGAHRRGGSDPYKMVARLAVLSNLLGHTTCYNCKSGKDRTGQLDSEAKMIAHRLAIGETPQPGEAVDRIRRTNFALKSGNLELQEYNSGLAGYKLDVAALANQLNSPLAQEMFAGDSDSVAA